jgi:hypothetical protein
VANWRRAMSYEDVRHTAVGVTTVPPIAWINRPTFQQVVEIGGDMDGDGCTDAQELGPDERLGGRRDPANPWDYFNPTGDRKNRIDDIHVVVQHFGKNQGDPGYSTAYDRTYIGPNRCNLGPPDGHITIVDIIAAITSSGTIARSASRRLVPPRGFEPRFPP